MGMSYLVYPGAHHTRFHHALGCMHLMQKAIQVLCFKGVAISEEEKPLINNEFEHHYFIGWLLAKAKNDEEGQDHFIERRIYFMIIFDKIHSILSPMKKKNFPLEYS